MSRRRKLHNVRHKQRERYRTWIIETNRKNGGYYVLPNSVNWSERNRTEEKSQRPWRLRFGTVKPYPGRKKKPPRTYTQHPDCVIQEKHDAHEVEGRQDIDLCMGGGSNPTLPTALNPKAQAIMDEVKRKWEERRKQYE